MSSKDFNAVPNQESVSTSISALSLCSASFLWGLRSPLETKENAFTTSQHVFADTKKAISKFNLEIVWVPDVFYQADTFLRDSM